jgi:D-alanine-D-alanine ligase-like ATP-grasp enzyme
MGIGKYEHRLLSELDVHPEALRQIRGIVADTVTALAERGLFRNSQDFEILGYDFLIERNGRVYILEANQYPGIHLRGKRNHRFYGNAIHQLFR